MKPQIVDGAKPLVLLLGGERTVLSGVHDGLGEAAGQWRLEYAADLSAALDHLRGHPRAVIVVQWPPHDPATADLLRRLRASSDCDFVNVPRRSPQAGWDPTTETERPYVLDPCRYIIMITGRHLPGTAAEMLAQGADDFLLAPFEISELIARIQVALRMTQLETVLRATNRMLHSLASTDPLLGILNRRRGLEILEAELARVQRYKQELSVILLDLDRFKDINDTFGHPIGDRVLVAVAREIQDVCRRYDSLVRWGGDELLVICPHTTLGDIGQIAERIRAAIAATRIEHGGRLLLSVTASLGAASVTFGSGVDAAQLIALADRGLYLVKNRGGDGVQCMQQADAAVEIMGDARGMTPS